MPVTKKVVTKTTAPKTEKPVAKKAKTTAAAKKASDPVPETPAPEPVVVVETKAEAAAPVVTEETPSTNDVFTTILTDLTTLTQQCKALTARVKALQKQVAKEHKELAKKGGKKKAAPADGKKRAPSGFAKPSKITPELAKFLNVDPKEKIARTTVTKMVTAYVKEHNLQNPENKKIIVPDAKLKKILKSGDEEVSFFNLQKFLKHQYVKDPPAVTASS